MSPTFRHSVRPPFATIELPPRLPQEVYNYGFSLAKRVMNLSLLRLLGWYNAVLCFGRIFFRRIVGSKCIRVGL